MLNPFFLQGSKSEQNLIQDLVNEQLKIYGVDVYYLPRQYITEKTVVKEVVESQFNFAYPIEAYIDSYDGFAGQGTILSKFGVQDIDDLNLIISKDRYDIYIRELIKNLPDVKLSSRPKEGDLIYFPFGNRLFEIKFVEHEKPFYQLRKNYVYELRCELFRYQNEIINTGLEFIDDPLSGGYDTDGTEDDLEGREQYSVTQTLQLIGIGNTATAITQIRNGGVRLVTVTNRGSGYKTSPTVSFSASPTFNGNASGIATMIGGIVDLCEPSPTLLRVQGVEITDPGYGYATPPKVSFNGGSGSGAEAFSTIGDGIVGPINITDRGSGYVNPPSVTFVGVSSIAAQAVAILNPAGEVSQIRVVNAGLGYTASPEVLISSPETIVGFGTYKYNEKVVGSSSGATAIVKSWNILTKVLEVSNSTGVFISGETVTGEESNATYSIRSTNLNRLNDNYGQNDVIQQESEEILDFSETNPFGIP